MGSEQITAQDMMDAEGGQTKFLPLRDGTLAQLVKVREVMVLRRLDSHGTIKPTGATGEGVAEETAISAS